MFVWVGGWLPPGAAVGSGRVRITRIGRSGHGSSSVSGTSHGFSRGPFPWLNQSLIMNCSHVATSALTEVAGMSSSRVSKARLTSRGLGCISRGSGSGSTCASGTFRPNRDPAMPMRGWLRSLWLPSRRRSLRSSGVAGGTGGRFTAGSALVS